MFTGIIEEVGKITQINNYSHINLTTSGGLYLQM